MLAVPLFKYLGPKWLRRALLDLWPDPRVQRVKRLVDTIDRRTREIFAEKKAAVERGDEVLMQQIGEGKDLMSILCASTATRDWSMQMTSLNSAREHGGIERRQASGRRTPCTDGVRYPLYVLYA